MEIEDLFSNLQHADMFNINARDLYDLLRPRVFFLLWVQEQIGDMRSGVDYLNAGNSYQFTQSAALEIGICSPGSMGRQIRQRLIHDEEQLPVPAKGFGADFHRLFAAP